MIKETIKKIEQTLQNGRSLNEKQTLELKILLKRLEGQVQELADKKEKPSGPFEESFNEVKKSIDEFESSHPDLVTMVNNISNILANMGI